MNHNSFNYDKVKRVIIDLTELVIINFTKFQQFVLERFIETEKK